MKILDIQSLEDCFDGSLVREVRFDTPINKAFIMALGRSGSCDYYPGFARPFFRITVKNCYMAKGVEGNATLRLILMKSDPKRHLEQFIMDFEKAKLEA